MSRHVGAEDFRESILQYLSQELNVHASMIVGFAVVLFAYLDIIVRHFFEPMPLFQWRLPSTWADFQYILIFLVLVVIVWGLVFVLFRLAFYGLVTRKTLEYAKSTDQFKNMWQELTGENISEEKLLGLFPAKWFVDGFVKSSKGLWISSMLSFIICLFLALTLFWKL